MSVEILYHVYLETKKLLQVIYAGDSAADEFAMEALKGVAYTYKVQLVLVSFVSLAKIVQGEIQIIHNE
jgi:hypothetical protein